MKKQATSRNARAVAAVRAAHRRYDTPLIYEDPLALELCGPGWGLVVRVDPLHWLVFRKLLRSLRPVHGQVLARARYAEDQLERAVRSGVQQYVILGAGLDSFGPRRPRWAQSMRIYELDHPVTQAKKERRLRRTGISLPSGLELIPVDFERASLTDALAGSSFRAETRSFFSWLGVTPYLTHRAITETLRGVRSLAAPGSELVLDYLIPDAMVDASELETIRFVRRRNERRREPYRTYFEPEALAGVLSGMGFEVVDDLSPDHQRERYFANRSDDLRPWVSSHFIHVRCP